MADCLDPNTPEVDNTTLECEDLISTTCVVTADADLSLRYGRNVTLTKVLKLISDAIKKLKNASDDYLPTYKSYTAILRQAGATVPTITSVIENSLSVTPTITVNSVGDFVITSTGTFTASKTRIFPPNSRPVFTGTAETTVDKFYAERIDVNTISLKTSQKSVGGTVLVDNLLNGVDTIRVYN